MDVGLGRPGAAPPPGADGRPGALAGRVPLPCEMPNGLLPPVRGGRAELGVGAPVGRGPAGVAGRAPSVTLGPAVGTGRGAAGRGPDGPRSWAALTAASCSALSCAARTSAAATSMSWALLGVLTGWGGPGTGPFLAGAFLGGAGRAPPPPLLSTAGAEGAAAGAVVAPAASIVARSRRATGASMVLDADLTNSPISFSLASTVLLSTPSSFASSCTRGLPATALLISRSAGSPAGPHFGT